MCTISSIERSSLADDVQVDPLFLGTSKLHKERKNTMHLSVNFAVLVLKICIVRPLDPPLTFVNDISNVNVNKVESNR